MLCLRKNIHMCLNHLQLPFLRCNCEVCSFCICIRGLNRCESLVWRGMSIKITCTAEWLFTVMGDYARCKSVFVPIQCSEGTPVLSANVAQIKKVPATVWYWASFCLFWREKKKRCQHHHTLLWYKASDWQFKSGRSSLFFRKKVFFFFFPQQDFYSQWYTGYKIF